MVTAAAARARPAGRAAPVVLAGVGFLVLYASPLGSLARDWWSDPDAGHGLLLAPLALWFGWRAGLAPDRRPNPVMGSLLLLAGVFLRYLAGLAAELFTMRIAMVLAGGGLVVFFLGWRQLVRWWLPVVLLGLSIPLPDVVTGTLALPLQLRASSWGAAMLELRHVPVVLSGNVIRLPGRDLFVTEACSGLRSLTALLALGVLVGGLWLRHPLSRMLLVALAVPVAMVVNAIRVFVTGFLVFFVSPEFGEGFMHWSEGWLLFLVAFAILGAFTWVVRGVETWLSRSPDVAA
jgi:exosortase